MTNKKIVGLPTIVTDRLRIVLDSNLRNFYGIEVTGTVLMQVHDHELRLYPTNHAMNAAVIKNISIGRFNLPNLWAKQNHVNVGDYVFLLATDEGLCIYPAALEVEHG